MPLLGPEPVLFPEDFLASLPDGGERDGCRWWVMHTKPRTEKSLARFMARANLAYFLPMSERRWQNKGRWFRSYLPLFPGYLFFHGENRSWLGPSERNLVAKVLRVEDQAELHGNLVQVHRLITSGLSPTPELQLLPGTIVEVRSGPLAGLKGKVLRRGGRLNFVIEVRLLQCGVSVELEQSMIGTASPEMELV